MIDSSIANKAIPGPSPGSRHKFFVPHLLSDLTKIMDKNYGKWPELIFATVHDFCPVLFEGAVVMELGAVVLVVALNATLFGFSQWQSHFGSQRVDGCFV